MRLFVLGFVAGVVALQHEAELPSIQVGALGIAAFLACGLLARAASIARLLVIVAAGGLMGYGYAAWRAQERLAEALPPALEGRDLEIVGVVAGLPQSNERGTRFLFHREAGEGVPRVLSLAWYVERGKGADEAALPRIVPGQRWRLTARLKRPRGLANRHAFDFEAWALERGIRATGYVRARPAALLLEARVEGWPYTLHRWRSEIRDALRERLAGARLGGVLVALAIGDQDAIAAADWEVFWRTGVGHLMSISGLHITMLAALAFSVVAFAWVRAPPLALRVPARKAALVAAVATAFAYSLLAGYQVPAQRTFCMLAVIALCVLFDRHGSPSRVLALAALAVVAMDPWAVSSAGFWLSFGAVASIFYAMALRTGRRSRFDLAAREQLAVTVALVPMLVALFQEFSLVSPLANAFAIPLVSLAVVPLTLLGTFLAAPAVLEGAHALMLLAMHVLEWLAQWPQAVIETHAPLPWTVAVALAGCAWLLAPRGVPMRWCGALWVAPLFLVGPAKPAAGEAWIDVLEVGNGLAVVVRTAHLALAYDAGPAWNEDADSGNRIVVPYLRGEGVRRLQGLVISHADDDHAGGGLSIAIAREPSWLLSPLAAGHPLHLVSARSIPCEAGLEWRWEAVRFRVMHPATLQELEPRSAKGGKENDRSCVLRVETAAAAALLTGDIEARSEAQLLSREAGGLRADVLLVPHHGSRSSSTAAFLDEVAPRIAVASVGHRNRFGHPHASVVARYAERGIAFYRTDLAGALRIVLPAESGADPAIQSIGRPVRYWSERRRLP